MAITTLELKNFIKQAFDNASDVSVKPSDAREQMAETIANAIESYVIGRLTTVTGTSVSGGPVTGTGVIQ